MAALLCRALVFAALAAPGWAGAAEGDARLRSDSAQGPDGAWWLRPAVAGALAGHAGDERAIGRGYEWGDALPQDYVAALAWYRRAAEHGSVAGMVDGGILVANGCGTIADPVAAVAIFRTAAALGSAAAETRLGMAYQWGRGVAGDVGAAELHYRTALQRGEPAAEVYLRLLQSKDLRPKQEAATAPHDRAHLNLD